MLATRLGTGDGGEEASFIQMKWDLASPAGPIPRACYCAATEMQRLGSIGTELADPTPDSTGAGGSGRSARKEVSDL
jgi:hypothetical protein